MPLINIIFFWILFILYIDNNNPSFTNIGDLPTWDNEKPVWMPNGKSLVFGTNRDGNWEIYIMDNHGSNQKNLTVSPHNELFPSISPDGSRIAYVSEVDNNYDVWVMNADGSDKKRLTYHEKLDDWPSWIEEGKRIVFDSDRSGSWGIYVMNNDGSSQKVLIDTGVKEVDPTTSPFSRKIVFSRQMDSTRQLFSFDLISGEIIRLTNNEMTNAHPAMSRNGDRIAFNAGGEFWDIYVMDIDGSALKRLTSTTHDDKWPAWSPDGQRIAFTSNRDGRWEIYIMNTSGNEIQRLTFGSEGHY